MAKPRTVVRNDQPFQVYFLNCGDTYRVWRDGWAGDQFEVISPEQFANLEANCKSLSIPLIECD